MLTRRALGRFRPVRGRGLSTNGIAQSGELRFGLTPVLLTSDLDLLEH